MVNRLEKLSAFRFQLSLSWNISPAVQV